MSLDLLVTLIGSIGLFGAIALSVASVWAIATGRSDPHQYKEDDSRDGDKHKRTVELEFPDEVYQAIRESAHMSGVGVEYKIHECVSRAMFSQGGILASHQSDQIDAGNMRYPVMGNFFGRFDAGDSVGEVNERSERNMADVDHYQAVVEDIESTGN